jgi:hypothetical protein
MAMSSRLAQSLRIALMRQSAIDQGHHGVDVFPEIGQSDSSIRPNFCIVAGYFQGSPGEIGTLQTVCGRAQTRPTRAAPKGPLRRVG